MNSPESAIQFPADVQVTTSADGTGDCTVEVALEATAAPGIASELSVVYSVNGQVIPSQYEFPIGVTTVQASAHVASTFIASSSFTVTVADDELPVARTQPVTVTLNSSGVGSLTVAQVNAGSTDNCGAPILEIAKGNLVTTGAGFANSVSFGAAEIGWQTVTLRATDASGNRSVQTASVRTVLPPQWVSRSPHWGVVNLEQFVATFG